MIAIIAALQREIAPLRRSPPSGAIPLATGMGREAVQRRLSTFLDAHRPQLLIATGFAGALRSGLQLGEIVLAERLLTEGNRDVKIDRKLFRYAYEALEVRQTHCGPLLTVSRPVSSPEEKGRLGRSSGALAAEMEAFWAAETAQAYGIPFLAMKVVLDPLERPLPRLVRSIGDGGGRWGKGGLLVLKWPGQLAELPWLARAARRASRELANSLAAVIDHFSSGPLVEGEWS